MKYIIESNDVIGYTPKYAMLFGDGYMIQPLEDLEELTADYINEHFGDLQDDAYNKGYAQCQDDYGDALKHAKDTAYKRGLDDAWEAARKISVIELNGGLTGKELMKIYGTMDIHKIYDDNTASEAIDKLKAYEEKQKAEDEIDKKITGFLDCNSYTIDEVFNRLKRMKGKE